MSKEVYIIAQIEVKDYKTYFKEYVFKFKDILEKYQGIALAGTTEGEVIEGERFGNWTVLMKFPSRELAYECINSKEYAPLAELQIKELTTGGT